MPQYEPGFEPYEPGFEPLSPKESFMQKLGQFAQPVVSAVFGQLKRDVEKVSPQAVVESPLGQFITRPRLEAIRKPVERAGEAIKKFIPQPSVPTASPFSMAQSTLSGAGSLAGSAVKGIGSIISGMGLGDIIMLGAGTLEAGVKMLLAKNLALTTEQAAGVVLKIKSMPKSEVFQAAAKEVGLDPYTIGQVQKDIRGTATFTTPGQLRPLEQGVIPAPPPPAPFKGRVGLPTQKPLQAGLPEQERAALEAFKARLPQNAGEAIPPMPPEMAAFRAKLPQGPGKAPILAPEAVIGPKPAIAPIPATPEFAGNIRLGKYSPEAQQGILAADKLAGVAERTPSTMASMKVTGATPEAQEIFNAVAKGESGALAGKTQLTREVLEKEAAVFAEQANAAIKAGGDELDNLIKTSPALQTAEQVSKVAQASGQTLGVFKQNASTALGKATVATLEKVKATLRATKSPFAQKKIEAIEKLQKALDKKELELSKLLPAYRKVMEVADSAYTFWINSILSNPFTHIRNIGGNTIFIAAKPIEKIMAASVDNVLSVFTGKAPEHTFKEAGAMIKAGVKHMAGKGEKLPFDPTKAGFGKLDRPVKEIQGIAGKIIGAPTKALEIEDNIAKNMIAQMEYAALKSKGITGDELTKRVMDEAAYRTYQDEAGKTVKWIMEGRSKTWGILKWVLPFVRTPSKLLERGLERTPLGALKVLGKAAKGAYKEAGGQAALAADVGNTILGSAASALLAMEYGKGNISGAWPTNARESKRWQAEGKKPYSYRTKNGWVALDKIEPFGAVVKTTIVTIDTFKDMAGEALDKVAMAAAAKLAKELVKMSAFNGFTNFAQSISDPGRYAGKTVESIATGFVPGASKFAVDAMPGLKDPLMRQKEGVVEMGMGKIPFVSERLKPKLDIWGQPIRKEAFFTAVSRARESRELDLLKELDLPVPKYPNKQFGYDFTRDEAFNVHQKAGPIIKEYLSQYVGQDIINLKMAKKEIIFGIPDTKYEAGQAGINDIIDTIAQLEILKIPFKPNLYQINQLATIINSREYRKRTPDERRARLNRMILGTP